MSGQLPNEWKARALRLRISRPERGSSLRRTDINPHETYRGMTNQVSYEPVSGCRCSGLWTATAVGGQAVRASKRAVVSPGMSSSIQPSRYVVAAVPVQILRGDGSCGTAGCAVLLRLADGVQGRCRSGQPIRRSNRHVCPCTATRHPNRCPQSRLHWESVRALRCICRGCRSRTSRSLSFGRRHHALTGGVTLVGTPTSKTVRL
jgi:hypothetical protein